MRVRSFRVCHEGLFSTYSNTSLRCTVFVPPHNGIVMANVSAARRAKFHVFLPLPQLRMALLLLSILNSLADSTALIALRLRRPQSRNGFPRAAAQAAKQPLRGPLLVGERAV